MSDRELSVYWPDGRPNFGDSVVPEFVEAILGRHVVRKRPGHAAIVTIGSLLDYSAFRSVNSGALAPLGRLAFFLRRAVQRPLAVLGTGFLGDAVAFDPQLALRRRLKVFALRGELSRKALEAYGVKTAGCVLGDPGLLFPRLWPDIRAVKSPKRIIGFVPHDSRLESEEVAEFRRRVPESRIISVREAPRDVFAAIAACTEIYSSSLHGLIAADSLGIPNRWVRLDIEGKNAQYCRFKFDDYYSAFGARREPVDIAAIPDCGPGEQLDRDRVAAVTAGLEGAFAAFRRSLG